MKKRPDKVARYAEMLSAMGAAPRLHILRQLLACHPGGMVVGEIQKRLGMAASTLSHHLEKLKHQGLVNVRRDTRYLWYSANAEALEEVLGFLFEECCSRSQVVPVASLMSVSGRVTAVPQQTERSESDEGR